MVVKRAEGMLDDWQRDEKLRDTQEGVEARLGELKDHIMKKPPVDMASGKVKSPDIIEIFSPPRVVKVAERVCGKLTGLSLDLRTVDEEGRRWDFFDEGTRKRALELIRKTKP